MPRVVPIVNNWQIVRLDKRMSGEPMVAAAGAMLGLLWNPKEVSTYDVAFMDGNGAPLDGRNRYVVRFTEPPPVNAFWSLTMYSAETQIFVPNAINRYSVGDRTQGHHGRQGWIDGDLPAGRRAHRSARTSELAAGTEGALLPAHPALLAEGRDPDGRLVAAADHAALIRPTERNTFHLPPLRIACMRSCIA